ncbi:MAG: type II CAAX endopeptidase family protein [Candidatus Omnitrophota bacterium]
MPFFKKNWIYIALFLAILSVNFFKSGEEPGLSDEVTKPQEEGRAEAAPSTFVNYNEAKVRSAKIEKTLADKPAFYLLYMSTNLFVLLIFLAGLGLDGYFLSRVFKKLSVFQKTDTQDPVPWEIGDIFKIIILAAGFSYAFFIAFSFFTQFLESASGKEFSFYKNHHFRMIFDTIILDFFILAAVLGFVYRAYRKKFVNLGFSKKNLKKNILYGTLGYIGIIPPIFFIGIIVYALLNIFKITPPPQPIVGLFLAEKSTGLIIVSTIIASIFGPIIEEIFFRGIMYNAVKRKVGIFWAIFITSVLFSFLHTYALEYFLVGFIPITILGFSLAYLYEKTGSLIPSVTLHILNNVGSVIMVFLFKYFNNVIT